MNCIKWDWNGVWYCLSEERRKEWAFTAKGEEQASGQVDQSVDSSSLGDLEVSRPFFLWSEPMQENVRVKTSTSDLKQLSSKPYFSHCLWDLGQVI